MKFTIARHKEMLANRIRTATMEQTNMQARLDKLKERNRIYAKQIEVAENEGKESFDDELYALKRIAKEEAKL